MNYFIKRDEKEYGPYSLADLQKYVASGNILLTDLCRSEGLTDWVPVSQVIGNIPVPAAPQPTQGSVYGGTPSYGVPAGQGARTGPQYPPPPNLHWAVVLLLTFVTCGLFALVWLVVEGVWLKKVMPDSKGFKYLMVTLALLVLIAILAGAAGVMQGSVRQAQPGLQGVVLLFELGYLVMRIATVFAMRSDIEEHFNTAE